METQVDISISYLYVEFCSDFTKSKKSIIFEGGPLVDISNPESKAVVGIVSFGHGVHENYIILKQKLINLINSFFFSLIIMTVYSVLKVKYSKMIVEKNPDDRSVDFFQ